MISDTDAEEDIIGGGFSNSASKLGIEISSWSSKFTFYDECPNEVLGSVQAIGISMNEARRWRGARSVGVYCDAQGHLLTVR